MSEKPKHDHDECHRILRAAHANEQSLRHQLAVTRAALAQCATALESARAWVCGNDEPSRGMARVDNRRISAALSNPDVEHAVRVEAVRDVVERHAMLVWLDAQANDDGGYDVDAPVMLLLRDALDALTSERKP